jgi:hypothetical protein
LKIYVIALAQLSQYLSMSEAPSIWKQAIFVAMFPQFKQYFNFSEEFVNEFTYCSVFSLRRLLVPSPTS